MRIGKLDNNELERLILSKFSRTRPENFSSPCVGEDCATLDFGGDLTVLSCDPITSASWRHLGRLSVHVNCNDAAAAGAEPVALLVTLLVPPSFTPEQIGEIADELALAAKEAGVDIVGGHTEVTGSVNCAMTCSTVIGRLPKSAALRGVKPGCDIVMTKWAGLEGSALMASDFRERLSGLVSEKTLDRARELNRLLSVVPESRIAMKNSALAMHDITEGGVIGAAWEMAFRAGLGMKLSLSKVPLLDETRELCNATGLNPYRLMSSGSLLIATENGSKLCEALSREGINAAVVGIITEHGFVDEGGNELSPPEADEYYKLL